MSEGKAPIFLIAGGRGMRTRRGPDPILQEVIHRMNLRRPTIAYVGAASGDDPDFRNWFVTLFKKAGSGEVMPAPLCGRHADPEKAKTALETSDIVFISGGDVGEGMGVLEETEMTGFLRRLHRSGKPFFGTSAGSIMLAQKWVCWKDPDDDESVELFPCLGLAPLLCDTHGEDDGWEELKVLLALSPEGTTGYGIVSDTALVIEPDGALSALGGEVDRFRKVAGKVSQIKGLLPDKPTRK